MNLLPIPNMHRKLRINLIENLNMLVNEIEAAQQRISREIVEGSSIEEVVDARAEYTRLRDRLDNLATISQLKNVGQSSPTGVFETVADLESEYPDGAEGVYVITSDGNFYFWNENESAWISGGSYQSTEWLDVITVQDEPWEVV